MLRSLIEVKPQLTYAAACPHCGGQLRPDRLLWQGMHVCVVADCHQCQAEIIEDLNVGHGMNFAYQIDRQTGQIWGAAEALSWLGQPLLNSFQHPSPQAISVQQEKLKPCRQAIVLNCIDFLYGHSVLKLLNAQCYLDADLDLGVIVMIPKFLRWMVPPGVAEIWTVNIALSQGQHYYPQFDQWVTQEIQRFDKVYISQANSHPHDFDITRFTQVKRHDFTDPLRITFIWRADRLWINPFLLRVLKKLGLLSLGLHLQNWRVRTLFQRLRRQLPEAILTIAGLGNQTTFPAWIDDQRVQTFDAETERHICQLYRQSRLIIGIHGSNLLLPSAHAGMTLNLMPRDRWGNFAQDILYQEPDPRLAAFRYRYVPAQTSVDLISTIASSMIQKYSGYVARMAGQEAQGEDAKREDAQGDHCHG